MEEEIAEYIESVVEDRSILEKPLDEARQSKIQGDRVQPEVMDLLDNHDALFRLCEYEYRQRQSEDPAPLVPVAEHLASEGVIDTSTVDDFVDFWEDVDWIVPALGVPTKNLGGFEQHWSDVAMKPISDQPEMMEYTLHWGVDEQLNGEIPGQRILSRAVFELDFIAGYFNYWQDNEEISDDMVSYLAEEYDIGWTTDMLRNVISQLESIDHGESRIADRQEDPDLEVKWDNSASGDKVVGTIRVTPAGETMKRDNDQDDGGAPPRGFQ